MRGEGRSQVGEEEKGEGEPSRPPGLGKSLRCTKHPDPRRHCTGEKEGEGDDLF